MTAPTYVARGTLAFKSGTTVAVPYYAGLAANDIAIIQVAQGDTPAISVPSGWSSVGTALFVDRRISFFWKRLTGSESGTVSVTLSDSGGGVMFGVSGCLTSGTPHEGFNSLGGTANINGPSITVSGTERLAVWGFFTRGSGLSGGSFGSPASGWTERLDGNDLAGGNYIALDTQITNSSISSDARGLTSDNWVSAGFALAPVGVAVPIFMNHYRNYGLS